MVDVDRVLEIYCEILKQLKLLMNKCGAIEVIRADNELSLA